MAKKTNFGKWTLPTSWEQVTLGQLQRIEALRGEPGAAVKIMSVLSGKDEDEVRALPVQFVDTIASAMSFLQTPPSIEPSCSCVIGGERYGVDVAERLTLGEWVAVQSVMQSDSNDVAGILAVVCRKDGEAYDSEFENEVYQSRRQMFLDAPCTEFPKVFGDEGGGAKAHSDVYRQFARRWGWRRIFFSTFCDSQASQIERAYRFNLLNCLEFLSYRLEEHDADEAERKFQESMAKANRRR